MRYRSTHVRVLALVVLMLGTACAMARAQPPAVLARQQGEADGAGPLQLQPMPELPWARLVSGTLAVAALTCLGVFLLKKVDRRGLLTRQRYMDVLEAKPLGRKTCLFLVRVAGRVVLLGTTGDQVTQLAEFAEDELPSAESAPAREGLGNFGAVIKRLVGARQ